MRLVKWHLDVGTQGADRSGIVEVEDEATTEEIEAAVREDMWNFLSLTWEELDAASEAATKEWNANLRKAINPR